MLRFPVNNSMFMHPRYTPESAWTGHIPFAAWLIEVMRPEILVELGTHRGASYLAFCQAVQNNAAPTKCYAVDTWEGDEHAGVYGDEIFLPLLDYHQRNYSEFSRLMRMRFEEAVEYFDDGSVDLLHIDGLHTYEAVRNDFETWKSRLSRRAVVLFHDINVREREFGVWKYWAEMRRQYPSFEFSHTHGLGVLLVGPEQPEALKVLADAGTSGGDTALVNRMFDHAGKVISSIMDIGTLAREQGRLAGLYDQGQVQNAQLNEEASALRGQVESLAAALAQKNEAYDALAARAEELERGADALQTVAHLRGELERAHRLAEAKDEELRNMAAQQRAMGDQHRELELALREATLNYERMRNSLSFRLMAPFRAMRRFLGGTGA